MRAAQVPMGIGGDGLGRGLGGGLSRRATRPSYVTGIELVVDGGLTLK